MSHKSTELGRDVSHKNCELGEHLSAPGRPIAPSIVQTSTGGPGATPWRPKCGRPAPGPRAKSEGTPQACTWSVSPILASTLPRGWLTLGRVPPPGPPRITAPPLPDARRAPPAASRATVTLWRPRAREQVFGRGSPCACKSAVTPQTFLSVRHRWLSHCHTD